MARADFVTALVLLALGLLLAWGGWSMDRLTIRQIHPASIPGLVPGLLGVALSGLAVLLLLQALRQGGHRRTVWQIEREGVGRFALALGLALVYALLLVGTLPYWLATLLFMVAFIAAFEWSDEIGRWRRLASALLQAALTAAIVAYVFQELFLVRLP